MGEVSIRSQNVHYVPGILAHELKAQEAVTRIQNLRRSGGTGRHCDAESLGYSPGLTVAAIMQKERTLLEAHRLIMHTRLQRHLRNAETASVADGPVDAALDSLQSYITTMTRLLADSTSDMKRCKSRKPHRFADLVRSLRQALSLQKDSACL